VEAGGEQGKVFLRIVGWLSTDYTEFMSQKTILFITTAVTASNPT
jgi:hypothetical protein